MFSTRLLERLRMRTTLLVPLLIVFLGWTLLSIFILSIIVEQQTRNELVSDLDHSISTYQNLQHQHHDFMRRQAALIADQPTIKALMTSNDRKTIEDGGVRFWQSSDSDLFSLFNSTLVLSAAYNNDGALPAAELQAGLAPHLKDGEDSFFIVLGGVLYEVAVQPIVFGDPDNGSLLGYLVIGYALDTKVAHQVSEAAAADVLFSYNNHLVGTLRPELHDELMTQLPRVRSAVEGQTITLGGLRYLATTRPLVSRLIEPEPRPQSPRLVVLKSFEQGQALIRRVNRWVTALSLLVLCVGTTIVLSVSRSVTSPLNSLIHGVRAMAAGDYAYPIEVKGAAEEMRELSRSFDRMRRQLQESQKELVQSERLATIGSMASSISHDLRHHLSAIYANAEFMSNPDLSRNEREELLGEVNAAVHDMTDLLESLLLFSQTGKSLQRSIEILCPLLERSINTLKAHPAARDVSIALHTSHEIKAYVDARKLGRAVYNLLLNACEAAQQSPAPPTVSITVAEDDNFVTIAIADNGNGVPESLRKTMFMPFVSAGKQSGTGLGLTLAEHIASEHGGFIRFDRTADHFTIFTIFIPKEFTDTTEPADALTENLSRVNL